MLESGLCAIKYRMDCSAQFDNTAGIVELVGAYSLVAVDQKEKCGVPLRHLFYLLEWRGRFCPTPVLCLSERGGEYLLESVWQVRKLLDGIVLIVLWHCECLRGKSIHCSPAAREPPHVLRGFQIFCDWQELRMANDDAIKGISPHPLLGHDY